MLCWIPIIGGLLIMMGHHDRSEALFYYFRLEDQVPVDGGSLGNPGPSGIGVVMGHAYFAGLP
jgi:hypothetical protein